MVVRRGQWTVGGSGGRAGSTIINRSSRHSRLALVALHEKMSSNVDESRVGLGCRQWIVVVLMLLMSTSLGPDRIHQMLPFLNSFGGGKKR